MDIVPPSYQTATTRDAWSIIAQYIPSSDLCAAVLVCRKWHGLFMPFLWGDPASHFGTDNDAVYVALTRFRRTLKYARLEVRMLTHTLHLPPALSEIYGGPRPEWLREILESLPCLQSLMVSKLPFFDHNAMTALKGCGTPGETDAASQTYNPNATSQGIAETLLRFPGLTYLDLSYTTPARDRILEHLQVLKLRGIGLKDNDAEFLANAIERRVRFLDLRNNFLTDMSIRSLLQASFLPPGAEDGPRRGPPLISNRKFLRNPPLDEQVLKALTQPLTGRSWVEDLPQAGITHLYIADNPISVEGAASLLASSRLYALDSISRMEYSLNSPQDDPHELPGAEKLIPILGTTARENLTYLRAHHAICTVDGPSRETATLDMLLPELSGGIESEVPREAELGTNHEIYELPSNEAAVFELPGTPVPQPSNWYSRSSESGRKPTIYEDNPLPERRRGSVFAPEVVETDRANDEARLGDTHATISSSRLPHGISISSISSIPSITLDSVGSIPQCSSPLSAEDPRALKIQELLAKRPKSLPRRDSKGNYFPYLHPSHVPHLETLVLTDVPSHVLANSPILTSLIRFITACSNEALLATLQAGSDYSLPPGRARARAEQERVRSLFALRRLVLEITPTVQTNKLSRWTPSSYRTGASKSSTGDRDSENLWSAAIGDFSFFGEEECGVPDAYSGKYFPMAALNEKVTLIPDDDDSGRTGVSETDMASSPSMLHTSHLSSQPNSFDPATTPRGMRSHSPFQGQGGDSGASREEIPDVDLVAELASFRRTKKAEYENMLRGNRRRRDTISTVSSRFSPSVSSSQTFSPSPSLNTLTASPAPFISIAHYLEGHWKGEVKIVRNAAPKGRSGVVDMYGNYFEKGYLYP
ncbi:leucine rich repeat domain protein [Aspergillus sclerotioniger CBS 115572]|uniref:Leucine rich repeat domain protein n=1 Tax=Aspergillus sclerotioniger CBS 115572 TaxID=1450535 RepID=A0A317VSZ4_9EURO|nr:leucine rich repeat domain protein [Aspergillus sclerotioniger CBS 115572]PWY76431.1 leucine rich repeat domain protein [Aspergillus sclerotioniger CBS 115572]